MTKKVFRAGLKTHARVNEEMAATCRPRNDRVCALLSQDEKGYRVLPVPRF